jgi:flagellin-like protein
MEDDKMMKFFRKHRKAVSPVIAVMLLVAVAVAAVGAYFIWFRSFQTQTQKSVQETSEGALGGQMKVVSITDDGLIYYVTIKNTKSAGVLTMASASGSFKRDAVDTNSTITSIDIPAGQTQLFTVDFAGGLITGKTHSFTFTAVDGEGQQTVETLSYTDS